MEIAIRELKQTLQEAKQYQTTTPQHQQHLQLHINALKEDAEILSAFVLNDEERVQQVAELMCECRRTCRHLERAIIDIDIKENKSAQSLASTSGTSKSKTSALKLTPMQLPIFDGNAAAFPVYRSVFEENILQNEELTDTAKWLRLKETLKSNAAELVSEIPQSENSLQIAWNLLIQVYGGDERPVVDLFNRLQILPQATMETQKLRLTHSKLEGLLMALEQLNQDISGNHYVRWTYMGKFPAELLYQVQKAKDIPLSELRIAISEAIAIRECTDQQRAHTTTGITETRRTAPQAVPTNNNQEQNKRAQRTFPKPLKCTFCDDQHWNDQCPKYPTIETRQSKLKGKCLKCLRVTHAAPCPGEPRRCFHCNSLDHNRALCPTKFGTAPKQTMQLATIRNESTSGEQRKAGQFLTFVAWASSAFSTETVRIRVLVDTAGGSSLLTRNIAEKLKIPIKKENLYKYTGLAGVTLSFGGELSGTIDLHAADGEIVPVQAELIHGNIPQVSTYDVQEFRRNNPEYDHLHIPPTGADEEIDLLIGNDSITDILAPDMITAIDADTLLLPTKFGHLIVGRQRQRQHQVCSSMLFIFLNNPLKQLSDLDVIGLAGIEQAELEDEERAISQFYETVQFIEGRYSISWPWRCYPPQLDSNFGLAMGRLKSLHKRLTKSNKLLHEYHEAIHKQLQQNIIEKVNDTQPAESIVHYLPHHPIIQPEKDIRPVIDGSSRTTGSQKSLNDNIRKGTKWLNDLAANLIKFRTQKTAVIADIARAFHQIGINITDRDAARFLWLKDPEKPPTPDNIDIFRFTRVAFGIIASPFILHAVIQHHANQREQNKFIDILLADMYADNLVTALNDDIDPEEFYRQAKEFFASMSMNLTKWATNSTELAKIIPQNDQIEGIVQSVLGIKWNICTDTLSLKTPKVPLSKQPTPRTIARDMAARFDPLGWAAPVVLMAKIFFREMWEQTKNWDEKLTQENTEKWGLIATDLMKIDTICIERQYATISGCEKRELHTFVDASKDAYAIVVYLRSTAQEAVQVGIIMSKTRLTPKKQITIPRLELAAILLGCKLTNFIQKTLDMLDADTYLWSDSKCAIAWMTQNKILPPILEKHITAAKRFNIKNIKYVPSAMNYADVASRGTGVETLQKMGWWNGPSWLHKKQDWPNEAYIEEPAKEIQLAFHTAVTIKINRINENEVAGVATIDITKFSDLGKLLRRTAYCLKALVKFRRKNFLKLQTDIDTNSALQWWIYWDQSREYALDTEPDAGQPFMLRNISVIRDKTEIIRCYTRLAHAKLPEETINPILLVKKSSLTKLIIMNIHDKHMHAGAPQTLAELRKRYWLPQGRREIQHTIHTNCLRCRRQTAKPYPNAEPAPLPEFRVTKSQAPFEAVGVDICGPLYIREKSATDQQKIKRWVIIFTCSVIRAVHLEILKNMSTDEILMAFRRFAVRRGVPKLIISDNAPQFRKLDECIKDIWQTVSQAPQVSTYFAKHNIVWKFINEYSPWMGGLYERLIQNVKLAFEKTYGNMMLTDRQFETSIVEIEAIINARPIAYVESDADTPILTPAHFLKAQYTAIPIEYQRRRNDNLINRLWRSSQGYLDTYWKIWSEYYLLMLRERNDQLKQRKTASHGPEKGDIVVLVDPSKKRSAWQIAVVERKIPGNDNKCRAVQIRLPHGTRLIKPIVKLAPLQLKMDLPMVHDDQLSRNTRNLTLALPEDAAQPNTDDTGRTVHLNTNRTQINQDDRDNSWEIAATKGKRGKRETGQCAPPNGSENGGGSAAVELESCRTSSASVCPSPRGVSWTHHDTYSDGR